MKDVGQKTYKESFVKTLLIVKLCVIDDYQANIGKSFIIMFTFSRTMVIVASSSGF